ncbi:MAG: DUF4405 domain-containing protein [Candidatus Omnitrophica bacterium]|nr:DUF4405 domain-containing protein [Candidatus Omnitrophota bacterium]
MNKMKLLKIVNLCLLLSFVVQAGTGIIIYLKIRLPFRPAIFEVHTYNGLLVILLALIHLTLNWGWIRSSYLIKKPH